MRQLERRRYASSSRRTSASRPRLTQQRRSKMPCCCRHARRTTAISLRVRPRGQPLTASTSPISTSLIAQPALQPALLSRHRVSVITCKGSGFYIAPFCEHLTTNALMYGSQFYLQITPYLPLPCKRSPDGAKLEPRRRVATPAPGESVSDMGTCGVVGGAESARAM